MYQAAVWLQRVKESYGARLNIRWYSFPLEQVNNVQGPDWKLWEQPDDYKSRGLWALRAGKAAELQGAEAFQRFHLALLRAHHEDKRDIGDRAVLEEIAVDVGLDVERFRRDLADRGLLTKIAEEYTRGAEQHGVWGTPTLVFNGKGAAYLKMRPAAPPEDSVRVFEELYDLISSRAYIIEVKRPR